MPQVPEVPGQRELDIATERGLILGIAILALQTGSAAAPLSRTIKVAMVQTPTSLPALCMQGVDSERFRRVEDDIQSDMCVGQTWQKVWEKMIGLPRHWGNLLWSKPQAGNQR